MTPTGVLRGKAGIRQAFTKLLSDVPKAKWNLKTQVYESDFLLLEWTADSAKTKIDDGIDTFLQGWVYPRADRTIHPSEEVAP